MALEDAPKLPPVDQAVLDKAIDANLTEANKAYAAYQTAVAKAQDQAIKALEKVKAEAMKKGNLALANAADAKIKEVRGGTLAQQVVDNSKGDLLGERRVRIAIPATKITRKASNAVMGGNYPDLLWTSGPGGFYELSVQLPKGTYFLVALMASGEVRPCKVIVNKAELGNGFVAVTGGFTVASLKSERVGPFEADGQTLIRIEAVAASPHFFGFVVTDDPSAEVTAADFKALAK